MNTIEEKTVSEYKVRPVTRFHVTRYRHMHDPETKRGHAGSESLGEFDNADMAYNIGYALAREEQRNRGLPPGDERVMFPEMPDVNPARSQLSEHDGG